MRRRRYSPPIPPQNQENILSYTPKIDKNPFYRTMDIMNGVFKKRIKLEKSDKHATDLKTIYVNFDESYTRKIDKEIKEKGSKDRTFLLECGHKYITRARDPKSVICTICGSDGAYLGFEHEWEHIIFKTDLEARALFVEQYATHLLATILKDVNRTSIVSFLHLLINALDDIRVNSLQEKVYPGSASRIWHRWRSILTTELSSKYNENFCLFVMAVALDVPLDPAGEFYSLVPVISWGVSRVRYRGFRKMLIDTRILLDRCMGSLISQFPPEVPTPPNKATTTSSGGLEKDTDQQANPQTDSQSPPDPRDAAATEASKAEPAPASAISAPSAAGMTGVKPAELRAAFDKLIGGDMHRYDPAVTNHKTVTEVDALKSPNVSTTLAMVSSVIKTPIDDLAAIEADQPDEPDADMAVVINMLRNSIPIRSNNNKLVAGSKAVVDFIDVKPSNITRVVSLTEADMASIEILRTTFFRQLGKQKSKLSTTGVSVDIPAFIQFKADRKDGNIFEGESLNRGFAFNVLSDMSGSMRDHFDNVGRAMEILKESLDFPFVKGEFWGFQGNSSKNGVTTIFRYNKRCKGYRGYTNDTKIRCEGETPMNSALYVLNKHVQLNVPAGMAKRIYLITDGSPQSTTLKGARMSEPLLRLFVKKEVDWARNHGIEVNVLIIGSLIPDEDALHMFGHRRFWSRVMGTDDIGKSITKMVLKNFQKYLSTR